MSNALRNRIMKFIRNSYSESCGSGLSADEAHSVAMEELGETSFEPRREELMAQAANLMAGYYFWDEPNEEKQHEMERIRNYFMEKLTPEQKQEVLH